METKTTRRQNKGHEEIAVDNAVVVHRVIAAPAKKIWRALTDAMYFKKWWGPEGYTCPYSEMEAKAGGRYLNCMQAPDGKKSWSTGTVQEFIPEHKLVVTDNFSDEKGNIKTAADYGMPGDWPTESLISFELEEADGATKLVVAHEGIPAEMHDDCLQGWNESLDKLEESLQA